MADITSSERNPKSSPLHPRLTKRECISGAVGIGIGIFAAGIGAAASTAYWPALGQYVRDFFLSPALGGIGVVVASCIALRGISLQATVSREGIASARKSAQSALSQQKFEARTARSQELRVEDEKSWWRSFDWVASHVSNQNLSSLALDRRNLLAAVDRLNDGLEDRNSARGFALASVVDALNSHPIPATMPTASPGELDEDDAQISENEAHAGVEDSQSYDLKSSWLTAWDSTYIDALKKYVEKTSGSTSESVGAMRTLYEDQLLSNVAQYFDQSSTSANAPSMRRTTLGYYDAVFRFPNGNRVSLAIKFYRPGEASSLKTIRRAAVTLANRPELDGPIVLVSPIEVPSNVKSIGNVNVVKWVGPEDTLGLVRKIAELGLPA